MQTQQSSHFYVVSLGKFSLLYFCTQGLFLLYWLFRAWRSQELEQRRSLLPILRVLLAPFFILDLFSFIRKKQLDVGDAFEWQPQKLAWLYISFKALSFLSFFISVGAYLLFNLLDFFVSFYVFYKVQLILNRIAGDNFGSGNKSITFQNQIWMMFGAYLWVTSIVAVVRGPEPSVQTTESDGVPSQQGELIQPAR